MGESALPSGFRRCWPQDASEVARLTVYREGSTGGLDTPLSEVTDDRRCVPPVFIGVETSLLSRLLPLASIFSLLLDLLL